MVKEITLGEYKKAYRDIKKEEAKRGFLIHLVVYIFVNAMLIAVNLLYSSGEMWFFYPLVGWGIGLLTHYLFSIRWIDKELKEVEAKAEYRAREIT